jgi:uncharacterized protein YkwD
MGSPPPRLWTLTTLAAATLALFVPAGCSSPPSAPRTAIPNRAATSTADVDPAARVSTLVAAHNQVRAKRGLPELVVSPRLEAAAQRHALDMADRGRMAHRGGDGSSPFRRIGEAGYTFQRAAENVAYGQPTVDSVMSDWMHSPGHRRNILGKYTEIGAATAIDKSGNSCWCVTFGEPAGH